MVLVISKPAQPVLKRVGGRCRRSVARHNGGEGGEGASAVEGGIMLGYREHTSAPTETTLNGPPRALNL